MTEELKKEFSKLRFLDENGETYPEWEEKKLKQTGSFYRGSGLPKADMIADGKYDCVHYGELFSSPVIFTPINRTNFNGVKFNAGAILMPSSDVTPDGLAKASVIQNNEVVVGGDTNVIIPEPDNNSVFLAQMIRHQKSKIIREVVGTTVKHIYPKNLQTIKYSFPSLPEQEKIANLLSKMDEKIEAQAKFVELLKKQKQGYSQKIFNGSLRFKKDDGTDFDDWEEKKLGEIAELKNGYAFKSSDYTTSGDYRVITIKNVSGSTYVDTDNAAYIKDKPKDLTAHQALKINDILISLTGNVGRVSVIGEENLLLNQRVGLIETNRNLVNNLFLSIVLSFSRFENTMIKNGQGGAQKNISKGDVESYKINLPSLPEQEKIAAFLSNLDNRIDEELNKLEKLKLEKNGYMQRMLG